MQIVGPAGCGPWAGCPPWEKVVYGGLEGPEPVNRTRQRAYIL